MLTFHVSTSSNHSEISSQIPVGIQSTIYSIILAFACSGNSFLIISFMKKKKKTMSCKSIMNLALCDLMLVLSSIPTQIAEMQVGYFPFGAFGCHILHPFSTMAVISASLTLVFLAFERFVAICHPFVYYKIAKRSRFLILTHLSALCCVIPYGLTLSMVVEHGKPQCLESWSKRSSFIYSIVLFAVQYGLPLPIICFLYFSTWRKLKETNDECVRRTQSMYKLVRCNDRGSIPKDRDTLDRNRELLLTDRDSMLKARGSLLNNRYSLPKDSPRRSREKSITKSRNIRKWAVSSERCRDVCHSRRMQTLLMFRLFVTIVIVFALFMLPNQITWLYMAFLEKSFTNEWTTIAYWLTYTNSVLNPVIYGTNQNFYKFVNAIRKLKNFRRKANKSCHYQINVSSNVNDYFIIRRLDAYRHTVLNDA